MKRPLPLTAFAAVVTIINLLCYDIPFFRFACEKAELNFWPKTFLMATLVIVLFALTFMLTYLLMLASKRVGRAIIALLQVLNAISVYFVTTYRVILDESMLSNVFNTRYSEAAGFLNWWFLGFVVLFGILPSAFVLWCPIKDEPRNRKKTGIICGSSLLLSLVLLLMNLNQTLWIGRYDTELGGLIMPWSYIVNSLRIASHHRDKNVEEIRLPDGEIIDTTKTAVVLVIGESSRKANFQLYGYRRPTNPKLSQRSDLHVLQANACATYTTAGVRAILEPKEKGPLHEILPNYAYRMGVDVEWRTMNWGEPPLHIGDHYLDRRALQQLYPDPSPHRPIAQGEVKSEKLRVKSSPHRPNSASSPHRPNKDTPYDELLLRGLRERIEQSDRQKVLIVLHTSTSHGPVYSEKYPKAFEVFSPVIDNVEQADKDLTRLVNAYDNSIVYTDHLLNSLIDTLASITTRRTAMLFVSDHGESLGENRLFMHGVPMSMAPEVQYEIPFLVWLSPGFGGLRSNLPDVIDQHYTFHSVLNLLSIQSPAYNADRDIFQPQK
ncbi:MAG: phosphoethanolamine transferase domain-containing protein [Paludibacteraceae bacterium]|nr:phosphoethanolamine transferase domain-containing protein [Paludibacteraceae bacterium]